MGMGPRIMCPYLSSLSHSLPWPHRTSAAEQQPPPMKCSVDRKDPTRKHMNVDELHQGQIRRIHTSTCPRRESYSIFREPLPSRLPEQDKNPKKTRRNN